MNRIAITLFTVVTAVAAGLFFSRSSWQTVQTQRKEYKTQVAESRKIQADRAELLHRSAELESPFGKEQRARELGYRKPYEKPLNLD